MGPTLDDLALEAAAGSEIQRYLQARGIRTVATLALLAPDEAELRKVLIEPLLAGWNTTTPAIKIPDSEKPIASAILFHMWSLAQQHWQRQIAPPPAPATAAAGTPLPAVQDPKQSEKIPTTLPAGEWTKLVTFYNEQKIHGRARQFPVAELLGAESILARALHEHRISKQYSPILLGEILAKRSFTSSGEVNPLSRSPKKSSTLTMVEGELVKQDEAPWEPRSMLALLDGLQSVKWAHILLQLGDELDVEEFFSWMTQRFRSRPTKLEQLASYYLSASWRLAMTMRSGKSYAEGTKEIMQDWDRFAEHMTKEDTKRPAPSRKGNQEATKGNSKTSKGKGFYSRSSPYPSSAKGKGQSFHSRSQWSSWRSPSASNDMQHHWSQDSWRSPTAPVENTK
eukprot:s227_g6.t1